ncbi:MAG: succinyl-diaminopimelate desuccinylase [Rubrivivax sp.]|jgi:succinyl-diaminopimelate desuccinylase|nr:succinyl-diaminopimelate desuccinylase [Rubrivivax sp.]
MRVDAGLALDALRLTESLIACPSVTPTDAGCEALLARTLAASGFECESLPAGPEDARVHNLWAVHRGQRPGPMLVLLGHTDVVPPGPRERWRSDPFVPTHRDGLLFGRGAVDMKAGVAAMVSAAVAWVREQPQHDGTLVVCTTSDEEGPSLHGVDHVVRVLEQRGIRPDACLIGEPTSVDRLGDTVKNGRRGTLSARLTVLGRQGHVAYPQLAVNPIHLLAPVLAELLALRWDEGNAHFLPTGFQCSNVAAGTGVGNMIPGELVLDFNFRFSPESTAASLRERTAAVLARHGLPHRIEWRLGGEPFFTPPGRLSLALTDAIESVCGIRPEFATSGGTSDGRFMARICPQVMEFGPRNATAHQVDESIEVEHIGLLAQTYLEVLRGYMLQPAP